MAQLKEGTRKKLFNEVNGRCFYCGIKLIPEIITWDHIIAKNNGGNGSTKNLCACCKGCNAIKGIYSVEEFRDIMATAKERDKYVFYFEIMGIKKTGDSYGR